MFNFDCNREECQKCHFYYEAKIKGYIVVNCSHPKYSPDKAASWRARDYECDHKEEK